MEQYISKDALIAEIERRISFHHKRRNKHDASIEDVLYGLDAFINTLEVKEVDLEKEIQNHIKECLDVKFPTTDVELIKKDVAYTAKKFFELGMSVSKQAMKDE